MSLSNDAPSPITDEELHLFVSQCNVAHERRRGEKAVALHQLASSNPLQYKHQQLREAKLRTRDEDIAAFLCDGSAQSSSPERGKVDAVKTHRAPSTTTSEAATLSRNATGRCATNLERSNSNSNRYDRSARLQEEFVKDFQGEVFLKVPFCPAPPGTSKRWHPEADAPRHDHFSPTDGSFFLHQRKMSSMVKSVASPARCTMSVVSTAAGKTQVLERGHCTASIFLSVAHLPFGTQPHNLLQLLLKKLPSDIVLQVKLQRLLFSRRFLDVLVVFDSRHQPLPPPILREISTLLLRASKQRESAARVSHWLVVHFNSELCDFIFSYCVARVFYEKPEFATDCVLFPGRRLEMMFEEKAIADRLALLPRAPSIRSLLSLGVMGNKDAPDIASSPLSMHRAAADCAADFISRRQNCSSPLRSKSSASERIVAGNVQFFR